MNYFDTGRIVLNRNLDERYYRVACKIDDGEIPGPRDRCIICHRELDDDESVARGVGPDCWDHVQQYIEDGWV